MGGLLDIGPLLVRARTARGLSQRELGERLGVVQQQIARWEACEYRTASLERLSRVADVLGVGGRVGSPADRDSGGITQTGRGVAGLGDGPVRSLDDIAACVRAHGTVLSERYGVRTIDVFGTFARGEQDDTCFVGLIVELARPTITAMIDSEIYLQGILGRRVQAGPLSSITPQMRPEIEAESVRIWANETDAART